ncbi:hypothetical protein SprV_0200935800 [Sparganum proliferum]
MIGEGGNTVRSAARMFIELCQLTNGVPRRQVTQQEPADGQSRYWRERYRWVEMEEAFDDSVGEFAPPEVPKFTYAEVTTFKRRVKKGEADSFPIDMISVAFRLGFEVRSGQGGCEACGSPRHLALRALPRCPPVRSHSLPSRCWDARG